MSKQKPIYTLDLEVYVDYFLASFRNIDTGNVRSFELYDGQEFDSKTVAQALRKGTVVTFNGNGFDIPLLSMAIEGADCAKIKRACNAVIEGGKRPYQLERMFNFEVRECDHIDLIEVAPGMVSLKIYGGRLHCPKMQDLPIDPSASITPEQRALLREYCANDLVVTETLYRKLLPQIQLRQQMSEQYGMDLRSKSDAQIAETVIKSEVEKLTNKIVERPEIDPGTEYKYNAPEYIRYSTPALQEILRNILADTFIVSGTGKIADPVSLKDVTVTIGSSTYKLGIGGLHSQETCVAHHADDEHVLLERDVASYYPNIIQNLGLAPKHMGEAFTRVYGSILARRLVAKRTGDKVTNEVLKICVNGSFGKLGSKWSVLFAPNLLIQTTVTGQLALLMLIERLESAGVPVVSANTDGVVIRCHKSKVDLMADIVWGWECVTGFDTEQTDYTAIYSRDINSYIGIKTDGKTKRKGVYAVTGIAKSPANDVCVDAAVAYVQHGRPVEDYIRACTDVTKFVTIRTVRGGALDQQGDYLGKAIRWVYGAGVTGCLTYRVNGYSVPRSEGATPLMELPAAVPSWIDFDWYIAEANSILEDIGAIQAPDADVRAPQLEGVA